MLANCEPRVYTDLVSSMSHRLGFKPAFTQAFLFRLLFRVLGADISGALHAARQASISPSGPCTTRLPASSPSLFGPNARLFVEAPFWGDRKTPGDGRTQMKRVAAGLHTLVYFR